jgi:hypothetical protein
VDYDGDILGEHAGAELHEKTKDHVKYIPGTMLSCKVKEITISLEFLVKQCAMFSRKGMSGKNPVAR